MNNFLKATNEAVLKFESLMLEVGWQDGYGLEETWYSRDTEKPLFFRNFAPALSEKFRVKIEGQTRIVYIIYNIIDTPFVTANDVQYKKSTNVFISVDMWYDDAFNFMEDASDQTTVDDKFMDFGSLLINKLIENKFIIQPGSETVETLESTIAGTLNRKNFIINKKF